VTDHAIHDREKGQLKGSDPLEIVIREMWKGNRTDPTRTYKGRDQKEKAQPQRSLT
jgi:hypothetical protein